MSYYAMIVVVECDRAKDAGDLHPDEIQFIGAPWEVKPVNADEEGVGDFVTDSVLAQREGNR